MDENPKHQAKNLPTASADDSVLKSSRDDPAQNSDNEDFPGTPLGARISYHAGLNLDERDAFKLCFPSYTHAKPTDPLSAGSGDSISQMIKKMRSAMGSTDPSEVTAMSEDDEQTVPVHYTESSMDLVSGISLPGAADKQEIHGFSMEETPHSVGDFGAGRRTNPLTGKNPTGNDCHVFSEGPATAASRTDPRSRLHNQHTHQS